MQSLQLRPPQSPVQVLCGVCEQVYFFNPHRLCMYFNVFANHSAIPIFALAGVV